MESIQFDELITLGQFLKHEGIIGTGGEAKWFLQENEGASERYETLDLEFHPKLNIFIGRNAQGKTNLLQEEAVGKKGSGQRSIIWKYRS